jgi:hypothetical protein
MVDRLTITRRLAWLALAIPGLIQLALLLYTVAMRFAYPYDLEWMEGGLLVHAQRIADGDGIYVAPSMEFIPYLYTPLYPGILATAGSIFGISYQLGRVISIVSLLGILAVGALSLVGNGALRTRAAAWTGALLAMGLIAAAYPFVEGWYDLVRADTLFLFLVIVGLVAAYRFSRRDAGSNSHLRVALASALLTLAFFCKQTGIIYVAAGGAVVLVRNWRLVPAFVATAGILGLGCAWLLERSSHGWFWTYIYTVHQAHDFNMARFWGAFGEIVWQFPAMSAVIGITIATVVAATVKRRRLPSASGPFLLWTWAFAVSCLVGALGIATQWSHHNAYMPALFTGALAAGAAVPAGLGAVHAMRGDRASDWVALLVALATALALSVQLVVAWWKPAAFIPTQADRDAGAALIARIHDVDGEVWIPSHPWYATLAGKRPWVHRMGMKDVTSGGKWRVAGVIDMLRNHRFAAIFLDNRDVQSEFPAVGRYYRRSDKIPRTERPHLYTGALIVPDSVWVPQ